MPPVPLTPLSPARGEGDDGQASRLSPPRERPAEASVSRRGRVRGREHGFSIIMAMLVAACAPSMPSAGAGGDATQRQAQPKRITIGVGSNLPSPHGSISAPLSGGGEVHQLLTSGLTAQDEYDRPVPMVADAVPTIENGLWKVASDGRMETTWRLRDGFTWADGVPVTADDLAFTMQIVRDRDMAPFYSSVLQREINVVQATDARTLTVTWRRPYIQADRTFGTTRIIPRHLLEKAYGEDKEGFRNLPYWTTEYVSNGPYKLREWQTGINAIMDAYDPYPLGRARIDQIEVRFVADSNTMLANVLADAMDVLVGARHLGFDQGLQAQERWTGGTVIFGANGWSVVHPQMSYANPAITMQSAQYRRAMLMAIDRQSLADTLQGGLAPVAHGMFVPSDPMYEPTLPQLVKWDYDPRRSAQMIEELGYRKGSDGFYADPAGQRLTSEIRTTTDIETTVKQMYAIQDFWNRLGVATEAGPIPPQRQQDREYRSNFCCFEVLQGGQGEGGLLSRTIANARRPENNWTGAGGTNYSNYVNPEHDAMIERYLTTIPMGERVRIAGQLLNHLSDQVLYMGVYYVARPTIVANGLTGIVGRDAGTVATHNVTEWDLRN